MAVLQTVTALVLPIRLDHLHEHPEDEDLERSVAAEVYSEEIYAAMVPAVPTYQFDVYSIKAAVIPTTGGGGGAITQIPSSPLNQTRNNNRDWLEDRGKNTKSFDNRFSPSMVKNDDTSTVKDREPTPQRLTAVLF